MRRKRIALLMAAMMAMTSVPFPASAQEFSDGAEFSDGEIFTGGMEETETVIQQPSVDEVSEEPEPVAEPTEVPSDSETDSPETSSESDTILADVVPEEDEDSFVENVEVIDDTETDGTEDVIPEADIVGDPADGAEMLDAEMAEESLIDPGNFPDAEAESGDFQYSISGENATLTKYTGSASYVIVPSTIDGYTVTSLSGTFSGNEEMTGVALPSTLTSIGNYAFEGCKSLAAVNLPSSVTSIGNNAFCGCSSLHGISLHEGITSIGSSAFENCEGITSITLPESVTSLGARIISNTGVTSITIPKNVTSCGYGWSGLNRGGPLNGALSLCTVTFEEGIKAIPANVCAFSTDSYVTSVTIPDSAESIDSYAFCKCNSLTEISIPGNVGAVGSNAFQNCTSLTSVQFTTATTNFADVANLTAAEVEKEDKEVHELELHWTFKAPERLVIGNYAFENCTALSSIEFANSIAGISTTAFNGCSALTDVTYPGDRDNWEKVSGYNSGVLANATIHYTDSQGGEYPAGTEIWIAVNEEFYNPQKVSVKYTGDEESFTITVATTQRSKHYYIKAHTYKGVKGVLRYGSWSDKVVLTVQNPVTAREVQQYATEFYNDLSSFLKALSSEAEAEKENYEFNAKSRAKILRESDEAGNSKLIQFTDSSLTDQQKDDIYMALAFYIESLPQFKLDEIKVAKDKELIAYANDIINAVKNNITAHSDYKMKSSSGVIRFNASGFGGAFFGSVILNGKYVGSLISTQQDAYDTMLKYLKNLCEVTDNLMYQSLYSIFAELGTITGISDFLSADVKELLDGFESDIRKAGFGKLLTHLERIQICGKEAEKIKSIVKETELKTCLDDAGKIWKEIDNLDLSDEAVRKTTLANAYSALVAKKENFSKALYAYYTKKEIDTPVSAVEKEIKKMFISCPVDFIVYDMSGNMVGCVKNGRASYLPEVTIRVSGDTKQVWMGSDDFYTIEFIGTGSGEMNYSVQEIKGSTIIGQIDYFNVPLSAGTVYTQSVAGGTLAEAAPYMQLVAQDDTTIEPSDHFDENGQAAYVNISLDGGIGGTVSGDQGSVEMGSVVCVKAEAQEGYVFDGWYCEDQLVETSAVYYFAAVKDTTLIARFEKKTELSDTHGAVIGDEYSGNAWITIIEEPDETTGETADKPVLQLNTEQETVTIIVKKYASADGEPETETLTLTKDENGKFALGSMDLSLYEKVELLDENGILIATFLTKPQIEAQYCEKEGHTFKVTELHSPTCGKDGSQVETCIVCGVTETTPLAATGEHTMVLKEEISGTCSAKGRKVMVCSVCQEEETVEGSFNENVHKEVDNTVRAATLTQNGQTGGSHCEWCGKELEKSSVIYRPEFFTLSGSSFVYNGKVQKPTVTVEDSAGKIIASSNYRVTYSAGCQNAGTYTVTVKFYEGTNYSGTKTLNYKINKAVQKITASSRSVTLSTGRFSLGATGTAGGGKLTYKSNKTSVALVSSAGTVTPKGVGTATITITAAANTNYNAAAKNVTITVGPKGTAISSLKSTASKKMTVKWKRNSAVTGYQIQYSTSKTFKSKVTKTITKNKTVSATYKVAGNKKYYVRIRTYKTVGGKKYYSDWSKVKTVTTKR